MIEHKDLVAGRLYKHHKNGVYSFMFFANNITVGPKDIYKFPLMVIYRSVMSGKIFARPRDEFVEKFSPYIIKRV